MLVVLFFEGLVIAGLSVLLFNSQKKYKAYVEKFCDSKRLASKIVQYHRAEVYKLLFILKYKLERNNSFEALWYINTATENIGELILNQNACIKRMTAEKEDNENIDELS